jgi:hypothetical protein
LTSVIVATQSSRGRATIPTEEKAPVKQGLFAKKVSGPTQPNTALNNNNVSHSTTNKQKKGKRGNRASKKGARLV